MAGADRWGSGDENDLESYVAWVGSLPRFAIEGGKSCESQ